MRCQRRIQLARVLFPRILFLWERPLKAHSHDPLYSQEDAERPPRTVRENNGTWWFTDSTRLKRDVHSQQSGNSGEAPG